MPLNRAYIPSPKGITKIITAIADDIALDRTGKKRQVNIIRDVQERFPDFPIPKNIWQKQLHGALYKKVEQRINGNMAKPVSIKGCKTLSQIKKRIKANIESSSSVLDYAPKISLSRKVVVVNGATYPVLQRSKKDSKSLAVRVSVKGKRQWIRLDALTVLLSSK